jgi:hypothetical protein
MFFASLVFISAVSISLTAAYFSVIGLATMFPGSKEAIIVMGGVLEIGKLIASVWLHHNWDNAFKFLKRYLLFSVVILSLITSMGIFGFLSRSHVEHDASIQKEQAFVERIDQKILREKESIDRKLAQLNSLNSSQQDNQSNSKDFIASLEDRVTSLKEEKSASLDVQKDIEDKLLSRIDALEKQADSSKPSGIFADTKKYNLLLEKINKEKEEISSSLSEVRGQIQNISTSFDEKIAQARSKIDEASTMKLKPIEDSSSDSLQSEIQSSYDLIESLETEKFEYGSKLRALEVEIGPILYIANLLNEWAGVNVDNSQAIRIVIITLIFVFDPLAILLLIAATMTYAQHKKEELPPDIVEIRNKLLDELQEYLDEGGIADHFIDRCKK